MKIKMYSRNVLTITLILLFPYLSTAQKIERVRFEQYKKQNRDAIADIVDGKTEFWLQ